MLEKIYAFIICLAGILLPWRLRIALSEILGWLTQFIYLTYYGILKFILSELKDAEEDPPKKDNLDERNS